MLRLEGLRCCVQSGSVGCSSTLALRRSFLADVERGKRNVSILNVELMAKGLKVSLSQLFSRL